MKTCNVCGVPKPEEMFNKAKANKGGLTHLCKECELAYRRSYKGKMVGLYKTQRTNSKTRGHPAPAYSFDEFQTWAEQNNYADLHKQWEASGFDKRLTPSTDRINDAIHYTFANMRLVTWGVNDDKGHEDFKSGKLFNKHTPVKQLTTSGKVIAEYPSQLAAERATGIPQGNIGEVCRKTGRRHTAGGYSWEFSNA